MLCGNLAKVHEMGKLWRWWRSVDKSKGRDRWEAPVWLSIRSREAAGTLKWVAAARQFIFRRILIEIDACCPGGKGDDAKINEFRTRAHSPPLRPSSFIECLCRSTHQWIIISLSPNRLEGVLDTMLYIEWSDRKHSCVLEQNVLPSSSSIIALVRQKMNKI